MLLRGAQPQLYGVAALPLASRSCTSQLGCGHLLLEFHVVILLLHHLPLRAVQQ